jgi:hypothetical protein
MKSIVKVRVFSAAVSNKGERSIHARIIGYGIVKAEKTPGIREWRFDREYAWTPKALIAINVALDVAWRDAMRSNEVAA